MKWSKIRSVVSDSLRPHDYILHGILQARIQEWVAYPFSRGSSQPRDQTQVSRIAGRFFYQLSHSHIISFLMFLCFILYVCVYIYTKFSSLCHFLSLSLSFMSEFSKSLFVYVHILKQWIIKCTEARAANFYFYTKHWFKSMHYFL